MSSPLRVAVVGSQLFRDGKHRELLDQDPSLGMIYLKGVQGIRDLIDYEPRPDVILMLTPCEEAYDLEMVRIVVKEANRTDIPVVLFLQSGDETFGQDCIEFGVTAILRPEEVEANRAHSILKVAIAPKEKPYGVANGAFIRLIEGRFRSIERANESMGQQLTAQATELGVFRSEVSGKLEDLGKQVESLVTYNKDHQGIREASLPLKIWMDSNKFWLKPVFFILLTIIGVFSFKGGDASLINKAIGWLK